MQVGGGELTFYTFIYSCACEFGAEPRPRGGPARRLARGRSPGPGCPHRAAWILGRPEGPGTLAVPSLHGLVRRGAQVFPPALELGWGPGLGSTRPLLGRLPGCCCGLGPGWRARPARCLLRTRCVQRPRQEGVSGSKRRPPPSGPIVWGTASGKWTQNAWMVAVA